jgi:hypothetical protein
VRVSKNTRKLTGGNAPSLARVEEGGKYYVIRHPDASVTIEQSKDRPAFEKKEGERAPRVVIGTLKLEHAERIRDRLVRRTEGRNP